MSSWNSICRICTSPGEYEIFEKIPAYLHASSNEFLNWQKDINVLLEETTGLKCSENDGLPNKICALCISYLKHAVFFREQCISNALALKAITQLRQHNQKDNASKRNIDKASVLITEQDLNFTYERHVDTNLLSSNLSQDQDKVCKQLLNNNFQANAPAQQNIEQQIRYLNLLFNKDSNAGLQTRNRRNDDAALDFDNASGDPYAEEDFPSATSSDENEASEITKKHNIFSYKEKNFEEDDIMDIDELRDAITINIPESCKERKCRACSRRFMFEDSFSEHMSTCIEYKFLTYIEEINKLLYIRRNKGISPHEFVRRMIFCIRKTCEWLKKANCGDMLLPDLVQNGSNAEEKNKARLESEGKSSAASSGEHKQPTTQLSSAEKTRKRYDLPKHDNLTDLLTTTNCVKNAKTNDVVSESSLIEKRNTERKGTSTPITISNNILYEIERSQSRSSNILPLLDLEMDLKVKKPIALLAAGNSTTNVTTYTASNNSAPSGGNAGKTPKDTTERLTFLQKLQQAANQQSPTFANAPATPATPLISVRKDLMIATPNNRQYTTSPLAATPKSIPITPLPRNVSFSARCNPCNLLFETLAALEVHNAMYHNHMPVQQARPPAATQLDEAEREAERKRIIALFEDEGEDDEGELE